jgi:dynein heavy chain
MFSCCLQERRKFGALGWNVPYEFSHADLSCALQNIQWIVQDLSNELETNPDSSSSSSSKTNRPSSSSGSMADDLSSTGPLGGSAWDALRYIVGQINYGGRMMDNNDLRLLGLIMEQHLHPSVLGDQHKLTTNGE